MKEKTVFKQRIMPESVAKKGYTYIPNCLIDNRMGFSPSERLFIQYLLMKPDGYIFYTREISSDIDLHRTTINDIKKKFKFLKYTKTGTGAYKSGWMVNFTGLWELISKYEKPEVSNFEVSDSQTEVSDSQTEVSDSQTEGNSATIKTLLNPIKTLLKQKDQEFLIEEQENKETEKQVLQNYEECFAQEEGLISPPPAALKEKIKIYFSEHFPNKLDYTPAFNKADISVSNLTQFIEHADGWATYPPIQKTDKSLHILVKNIKQFNEYNRKNEEDAKAQKIKQDDIMAPINEINNLMSELNVYRMDESISYDEKWHALSNFVGKHVNELPEWIVHYFKNPNKHFIVKDGILYYNNKEIEFDEYCISNIVKLFKAVK